MTPREATLQFLKFFARNYMPLEIPEAARRCANGDELNLSPFYETTIVKI